MARLPGTDGPAEVADRIRARRGGRLRPTDELLLHSPAVADGWNALLGAVRQRTSLPPQLRELIILRVAVLTGADYEWAAHEPAARRAGLTDAQLAAVAAADAADQPALDPGQRRVIALADAMTRQVRVPDQVFDALRPQLSTAQLIELVVTVAAYNMVSRFLVALQVEPPRQVGPPPGSGRQVGPPPGSARQVGPAPGSARQVGPASGAAGPAAGAAGQVGPAAGAAGAGS
jgi:4-carboxymuconolactone decarboxylase